MKIFRWIVFIPAFLVCVSAGQALGEIIVNFLHDMVFPLKNFWDYLNAGWGIPLILTTFFAFIAGVIYVLKIAPDKKLGARIILGITILLFSVTYIKDYESKRTIQIIFDVTILIALLSVAFSDPEPE